MKIIRFKSKDNSPRNGWVQDDMIGEITGSLFGEFHRSETSMHINDVDVLAPVTPSKIICVGRNYIAHAKEHDADVPEIPLIFLKPPSSLIGHNEKIILPPQSNRVEHEAELVVVIGKSGRWIEADEATEFIFGYTIGNDVTARDLQRSDSQWTRGKGFDTFCPIGPWIDTDFDPSDVMIHCRVNGQIKQMGSTSEMVFKVPHIIAFVSSFMTLEQGDIIMTGTPAGVSPLTAGDEVEVEIQGLGKLKNLVRNE